MTGKHPDRLLNKVDGERREFVRKIAIGTAYAVPVLSTFSLESVRRNAHAQGTYTAPPVAPAVVAPKVISFGPVPGDGAGLYAVEAGNPTNEPWVFVITYDRPMDTAYRSAKKCVLQKTMNCPPIPGVSVPDCGTEPTGALVPDPTLLGCPDNGGLVWNWNAAGTKEFASVPACYEARLFVWLNHTTCSQAEWYRAPNGTLMEPYYGVADICYPGC